jgi:DNA polymerase III delta prime subunit
MSKSIENILIQKYQAKEIAHFYLVGNTDNKSEFNSFLGLEYWSNQLISKMMAPYTLSHLKNNADVLVIGKEKDNSIGKPVSKASNYQVEELAEINKFLCHRPLELPIKILIIFHAHLLPIIVQNKLLKVLEEPENDCVIFMLNPTNAKLLPTIESRAYQLRVRPSKYIQAPNLITKEASESLNIVDMVKSMPLHQFIDENKKQESLITLSVIEYLKSSQDQRLINTSLELLKWLKTSKAHNNSIQQRLFEIYQLIRSVA